MGGDAQEAAQARTESNLVLLGLVVGCLLTSLAVCGIVGLSVYSAELEARRCESGQCDCELP